MYFMKRQHQTSLFTIVFLNLWFIHLLVVSARFPGGAQLLQLSTTNLGAKSYKTKTKILQNLKLKAYNQIIPSLQGTYFYFFYLSSSLFFSSNIQEMKTKKLLKLTLFQTMTVKGLFYKTKKMFVVETCYSIPNLCLQNYAVSSQIFFFWFYFLF